MKDRLAPVLAIALVLACIVVGFIRGGGDFSKMGFLTKGPENASSGGGGASIPAAANNAGGGTTMGGTDEGGSGASASTNGSSTLTPTLNRTEPSGETLALIESTFSNNSSAPSKATSVGNDIGRGINSGGAGHASGDGAGSSGASVGSGGGGAASMAGSAVKARPPVSVISTLPSEPAAGAQPGSRNTGDGEPPGNATNSSGTMLTGQSSTASGGEGAFASNGAMAGGSSAPGLSLTSGSNISGTNITGTVASGPIVGGGTPRAPDATFVWTGGNGANTNVWNQAGNWSPSGPPTINDTAQFDNTANASNLSPTIGNVATSVGAILFAAGTTNSYNITNGTGVLTIGSATVSGITNASATNQQISADILLGVSQTWNVQSTGNLTFTSAASIATGGNTLTLAGSSTGQGSIAGVISGTGSLIENGSGTWIITGANTFTGTTTVNGGTLLVNGAGELGSGAVTVNGSGTTLGGTATNLNRPSSITIGAGANLAPATIGTAGTLQIGSTLTLSPGSNFRVDLLGTGQGTTYDLLNGPGGGASGLVFAGSNLVLHVGIVTTTAQTFTILHQGGGFGGQQFAQGGFVLGDDLKVYSITYTGDNIILQWTGTIIPEPGTWLGGALGVVAVAFTQCRRLRKLMARRCVVGS